MRQPALMATALPVAFHIVYINFAIITLHVFCDDVENKFFFFFFFLVVAASARAGWRCINTAADDQSFISYFQRRQIK